MGLFLGAVGVKWLTYSIYVRQNCRSRPLEVYWKTVRLCVSHSERAWWHILDVVMAGAFLAFLVIALVASVLSQRRSRP